ncbi:MAG TPA: SEC-C domain-containing protein, partial [Acidimicrobiales bacterium]|nr:SEC-C domain-containing protein [Acidimicrobiales bacterium]
MDERASRALDVLRSPTSGPDDIRPALRSLVDVETLAVVSSAMLTGVEAGRSSITDAAGRALAAARRPEEVAVAHFLAALAAEHEGDVAAGEEHVHAAAAATPEWPAAVDRLAWYESDRGHAADALRLWRRIGVGPGDFEWEMLAPFAEEGRTRPARNEPCWCGSGRKFKSCHLGVSLEASLPDRVPWLRDKAACFVRRRDDSSLADLEALAGARAGDGDEEEVDIAWQDPLVMDVALAERGWFARFLEARRPLLPTDEAELARTWLGVTRSLFRVDEVSPGVGLKATDLLAGASLDVRDRAYSRHARVGSVVCGRAVPDSVGHQFLPGLVAVPGDEVEAVRALVERGDGVGLLGYLAGEAPGGADDEIRG